MKQRLLLLLFSFCITLNSFAQVDPAPKGDLTTVPNPNGFVNDFADILSEEQENILEKYLKRYELNSSRQIAIVSVSSLYGYSNPADLTTDLSNKWGLGQEGINNGLMILIAPNDRKMRIGTGKGSEKILTDDICAQVLNQQMIPFFKDGHFYEGILAGLILLQERWGALSSEEKQFLDAFKD